MPEVDDILTEWETLKDKPEVLDETRVKENKVGGAAADSKEKLQNVLPPKEEHYKKTQELTEMLDYASRGRLGMLGQKKANYFRENYTGTGRIEKKPEEGFVPTKNAPQNDAPQASVVLYERCTECCEVVHPGNVVPDMEIIPPKDRFPDELLKWAAVGLKPGMIVCSFFCGNCAKAFMAEHKRILNDPIANAFMVMSPEGTMIPSAVAQAEKFKHDHRQRTRENIIMMIKQQRYNRNSKCFYGDAVIR